MWKITFVQHHPFEENGRSSEALLRKFFRLEASRSSNLSNSVSRVKFTRKTTYFSRFESVRNLILGQNFLCPGKGSITVCLVGQPQMLQERCPSTLFSSFKWFSMQKEHCLSVRVWQCEQFHLCANGPFPLNGTGTMSLASRCQGSQQELKAHCFPVRVELACERSACQMKAFDKGESFTPWKIPTSEEIDQHL
jgi:hypothetical protein